MPVPSPASRSWVDRGGTFTDIVTLHVDGTVSIRKVRSDAAVVGSLVEGPFCFGTTVATNALLERKVVPTLLVVSPGFADLVRVGDMTRPSLFDADAEWPEPLCAGVWEDDGLSQDAPASSLPAAAYRSIAIALLGSAWDGTRERELSRRVPRSLPVSLGHQLTPEVGYLARIETTLVDAAVTPVLHAAMQRDCIPDSAMAIRSDGSLCGAAQLRAADAVLSGPAGGVLAVEEVARLAGVSLAVGLDMGGTSTDVCLVEPGSLRRRQGEWRVAGVRVRRPALEVETIAAGGGSILGHDGLGWTVGPGSAGSNPGPQVFGRGGPATLTDAAVAAGLVDVDAFDPPVDASRVQLPGPAESFLAVARESMAGAVRRLALARGVDVSGGALVAFGGAAGQHACAVAERLGMRTVLVHGCASVMSAWGQSLATREEERVRAVWGPLDTRWAEVEDAWRELSSSIEELSEQYQSIELRYQGTDTAIDVPRGTLDAVRLAHAAAHRRQFGFDRPELTLEVVAVRVRVKEARPRSAPVPPWPAAVPEAAAGPVRLSLPGTTLCVPEGWSMQRHGAVLVVTRGVGEGSPSASEAASSAADAALQHALWGRRFAAVAEDAGEVLQRLARSVNIRERRDFSCAAFDGDGTLIANAPHVPVHLGAMGETVRDLIRALPGAALQHDGDAWLTNDPAAGGSHLPDLTVVTVVATDSGRWFVANRAHHVDVGGRTPGSMPPRSVSLAEEGLVFRRVPLVVHGELALPDLSASREPPTVAADLVAQLAANRQAARELRELGSPAEISLRMAALVEASSRAVGASIDALEGSAEDDVDGVPLRVRITGRTFDFTGTGGPHPGNLNAPSAVLRSAVLYVLRVLLVRDLPLNEGVLAGVRIVVPPGSILDPPSGAAVVGGNVETSQRVVDLLLRALGARAASAGTMSNLTLGGEGWAFYETIGGGVGASPSRAGRSGRQTHMTNTRATDPEVMAARLPLRVRRFALRVGSGGQGAHAGGDGLIREIEVLAPCVASLLAAWRPEGAPGSAGGGAGHPGRAEVCCDATWRPWNGDEVRLVPGDRVRVCTPGGGAWGRVENPPKPSRKSAGER